MPEKRNYQFISTKITYDAESVSINNSSTNHIYRLAPIDYNNYENYWLDMVRDLSQTSHYARDLKIGAEKHCYYIKDGLKIVLMDTYKNILLFMMMLFLAGLSLKRNQLVL